MKHTTLCFVVEKATTEVLMFFWFNVFIALPFILSFLIFINWKSNNRKTKWVPGTGIWKMVFQLCSFCSVLRKYPV